MIYNPKNIEEYILFFLQKGSLKTTELLKNIKVKRPGTTKQALYKVITKLKEDEVIVVRSKYISLSHLWINKMSEYFNTAKHLYTTEGAPSEDFLQLEDGDKITYTFKNPNITDMFWSHAFSILSEITIQPICLYNPHEWFMLGRYESERKLFDNIRSRNKKLFLITANKDELDKSVSKEFDNKNLFYYMLGENLFPKDNYYLNIFDDFIIEVWIDKKTSDLIDTFYKEHKVFNQEAEEKLKKILEKRGKNKMVISRNKHKADKLHKIFKKYFVL